MKVHPLAVHQEEFDKSAVLFRPDTGESFMLNPTGSFLWKELAQGKSETEAFESLKNACGNELPPEAEQDVRSFVQELKTRGYITD